MDSADRTFPSSHQVLLDDTIPYLELSGVYMVHVCEINQAVALKFALYNRYAS